LESYIVNPQVSLLKKKLIAKRFFYQLTLKSWAQCTSTLLLRHLILWVL